MKKAWIRKVLFILCLELVRIGIGVPVQQLRPLGAGNVTQVPELPMNNMDEYDLCGACLEGVNLIDEFISNKKTFADIKPFAINLCVRVLTEKGYHGDYMCPGIVEAYGPGFIFATDLLANDTSFYWYGSTSRPTQSSTVPPLNGGVTAPSFRVSCVTRPRIDSRRLKRTPHQLCYPDGSKLCGETQTLTWFVFVQLSLDPLAVCEKLNYCFPSMDLWKTTGGNGKIKTNNIPHSFAQERVVSPDGESHGTVPGTENVLRILQLSDVHVDPYYTAGAATDCGLYLCCRSQFNGTGSAGQYGNYDRCDLPAHTLDVILSAIKKLDPAPDFIIYTGDSPPHDVWRESWSSQLQADSLVVQKLSEQLEGFTIYPAIGNHESFPESFYYQPSTAYQALNSKLATLWGSWFNVSADQRENIKLSAYYTTLVRPGLRILSFNTDYGYLANFYFLLNDRIPAYWEQQQFMKDVLAGARQSNEKVILIGHVPPGDKGSSTMEYGNFYTDLAVNYSDVIALHLFGHTHHDEFELILNPSSQMPHGPIFISPSVTTYGKVNPGFRVYHLEPRTFRLLDYEQYYLNITAANAAGKTDVKLLYTAKEEYGLSDMSAQSWNSLSDRLRTNTELLSRYRRNYLTGSGLQGYCDESCKQVTWCKTRSASLRAYLNCVYNTAA